MLRHVSINQKKQQTRIEELCSKNIIGNGWQLLGESVLTDPMNEFNDDLFQDKI